MLKFIFVRPQLPQNMGAAARILKNFGFDPLCLHFVQPLESPCHPDALSMSAGADEFLIQGSFCNSWEEAVAGCHLILATTACPREMEKPVMTPCNIAEEIVEHYVKGLTIGIVFGPERTGLTNDEIGLCQKVITIPVNPEFSSLNLAQACAIIAYEVSQAIKNLEISLKPALLATQEEVSGFLQHLEGELDEVNYWRQPSKKPIMKRNLWNIFTRLSLTAQEVRSLRGMIQRLRNKS